MKDTAKEQVLAECQHEHHSKNLQSTTSDVAMERAASMFKALSDPGRLKILEALSHQECCVTELAQWSGDEVYTISQRLRILRNERLVERRRQGKHVIYRLADCHVTEMIQNAFAHASE